MECIATQLNDAKLIKPTVFEDDRGFFLETWRKKQYDDLLNQGNPLIFVQDNHSRSTADVLRGLHFQHRHPQGKLIRAIAGSIYDVIVDLRTHSSTFGQWEGFYLSAENKQLLWVPPGFAHAYYTMDDHTEIFYKCTGYYHPEDEHTLIWNDSELAIDWPLLKDQPPILSNKDSQGLSFKDSPKYF